MNTNRNGLFWAKYVLKGLGKLLELKNEQWERPLKGSVTHTPKSAHNMIHV